SPLPSRRLMEPVEFVTKTSGLVSPLKSPTTGDCGEGERSPAPEREYVLAGWNWPDPPRRTERSVSSPVTIASGLPSPLRSAATTPVGRPGTELSRGVAVVPAGETMVNQVTPVNASGIAIRELLSRVGEIARDPG